MLVPPGCYCTCEFKTVYAPQKDGLRGFEVRREGLEITFFIVDAFNWGVFCLRIVESASVPAEVGGTETKIPRLCGG